MVCIDWVMLCNGWVLSYVVNCLGSGVHKCQPGQIILITIKCLHFTLVVNFGCFIILLRKFLTRLMWGAFCLISSHDMVTILSGLSLQFLIA